MKKLLCVLLLISLFLSACSGQQQGAPGDEQSEDPYALALSMQDWPMVSACEELMPYALAAARAITGASEEGAALLVQEASAADAYSGLIDGSCGLIFCPLPEEEQVRFAQARGVTLACVPVIAQQSESGILQWFAVFRGGEEDSPAGQIAQWCAWPNGQELARALGYTPNEDMAE